MVSLIGIIGTFSIVIVFSIYFLTTLYSYIRTKYLSKIFLMTSFLSTVAAYFVWGLRVLLIPQFESNIDVLLPYWTAAYLLAALSFIFLDFAIINLIELKHSIYTKIITTLIVITYVIAAILIIVGFDVRLVIFMDVTDLTINDQVIYLLFIFLMLLYLSIPNIFFINYIRKFPSKSILFKRSVYIELGLFLFSIGSILDGARFPSNLGILIMRIIIMIGGLFMIIGFYTKSQK